MSSFIILAQITSVIGWLLLVYSYYKDDIDKLLFIQIISSIFYCISYLFLGAYSGLLVCFIELLKGIGYYKTDNDEYIFLFTLPIYFVIGIFSYDGLISLLPIIGSVIDGFSLTKNKTIATAGSFISNILWVIYDISIIAYMSALTDAILVISNMFILMFGYSALLKTRRLRFIPSRLFNVDLYNDIFKLDKRTYGEEYTWSFEYEKLMRDKDLESLILIKYHNDIVGYLNHIVVEKEEFDRIVNSDESVFNYEIENIVTWKKSKKNYMIIDSINIKSEFQNEKSVELITNKIKKIIVSKYKEGFEIECIACTAITKYEKGILEKLGFVSHKKYNKNEELYLINRKEIEQLYLNNIRKRKDFKVFESDNIKETMFLDIIRLDNKFFKDEYLWSSEYQKQIFEKNKNSLIVATYKNKVVGYLNYLNITKDKYMDMINSNNTTDEFDLEDISKFYKTKHNYITINSIVIDKSFQNGYVIQLLTNRLRKRLKTIHRDGYKIVAINSFAVSEDGKKFLERLNFEEVKKLKDGNYLYVLENDKLNEYLSL